MRVTRLNYSKLYAAFVLVEQFLKVGPSVAADGGFVVPESIGAPRLLAAERALADLNGPAFSRVCERTARGISSAGEPSDVRAAIALLRLFAGGWQS